MAKKKAARGGRKSSKKSKRITKKKGARRKAQPSRKAAAKRVGKKRGKQVKRGKQGKQVKRVKQVKRGKQVKRRTPVKKAAARTTKTRTKAPVVKPRGKKAPGARTAMARQTAAARASAEAARKAPALDRERRRLAETDEERMPSSPSSLGYSSSASAARSGRGELREALSEHTESSPALTGGDVDADWREAYAVGDEAPGGDNPTPDQDRVDDIGKALGVQYNDNEELKGSEKIIERDRHRWELDPASSDDYRDRSKDDE